jgi:hypothetical protein
MYYALSYQYPLMKTIKLLSEAAFYAARGLAKIILARLVKLVC